MVGICVYYNTVQQKKVSLVPILLLTVPDLRSNDSFRHHSGICWWMLLVGLCVVLSLPYSYSESGSTSVGCYYNTSVSSKTCYTWYFCYQSLVSLQSCFSPCSCSFPISYVIVVSFDRFFPKNWVEILQYIVVLRVRTSVFYLILVISVVKYLLSFLCSVLFRAHLLRVPAKLFFWDIFRFFLTWPVSGFLKFLEY